MGTNVPRREEDADEAQEVPEDSTKSAGLSGGGWKWNFFSSGAELDRTARPRVGDVLEADSMARGSGSLKGDV